jgi:hypothetical protein
MASSVLQLVSALARQRASREVDFRNRPTYQRGVLGSALDRLLHWLNEVRTRGMPGCDWSYERCGLLLLGPYTGYCGVLVFGFLKVGFTTLF